MVFRPEYPRKKKKKIETIFWDDECQCSIDLPFSSTTLETRIICLGILVRDKADELGLCEALSCIKAFTCCDSTGVFAVEVSKATFWFCKIDKLDCKGMGVPVTSE